MKKLFGIIWCLMLGMSASAQNEVPMADLMRSNGKIYVVVGVLLIIFLGLTLFMFSLERRIKKLEAQDKEV